MSEITIKGIELNQIHGSGETCLMIYPFSNYRLFTLFQNWKEDDRKPLDLSDSGNLYLVFKQSNKEIRIPEYDLSHSSYQVDKVNGQVLFYIEAKKAREILSMNTRQFFITRKFDTTNYEDGLVSFSDDEEVLYTGRFGEKGVDDETNYSEIIKELNNTIKNLQDIISGLEESNAELIRQNLEYSEQIESLIKENNELNDAYNQLLISTSKDNGFEYDGTVISDNVTLINAKIESDTVREGLQEQLNAYLKELENDGTETQTLPAV